MNDLNIEIFDYIFNIGMLEDIKNHGNYVNELNDIIKTKNNSTSNYEFWNEYNNYFSDSSILDVSTLDGMNYSYAPFPKMTMTTMNNYLKYKCNQFKKIIENDPNYNLNSIEKDLNITNCFSLKKIIDYLINEKILLSKGKYFIKNILGEYNFDFYELEVNWNYDSVKEITPMVNQTIVNNNGNMAFSQNGNATLNVQNSDELFKIVLEKIDLMRAENISEDYLNQLIESCNKKDSRKVVEILKTLAIEVSSSLVIKGILATFGISC